MRRMLLCLAVLIVPIFAGPPMTTLTIAVTSESGKPVDRASVIVKFVRGHSLVKLGKGNTTRWEMKTSQEGTVTIPPIPQGEILIQVIAKNYQTFGDTFDVDQPQKTIAIKLNPPQKQYSAHEK